jgi:hypothetical protein
MIVVIIFVVTVTTSLNFSGSLATKSSSSSQSISASTGTSFNIQGWNPTAGYPIPIWTQSCVAPPGMIACVGGLTGTNTVADVTGAVYYASASPSGVGQWKSGTSYPVATREESCVTSSDEVYCVGGYTNASISASAYYAPISSSGVGHWTQTTSYPFPVWGQSCTASLDTIYCIGGITGPSGNTSMVYYAPLSSSGIGIWVRGTDYPTPIYQESCVASDGQIDCIGGLGSAAVYHAEATSSGLGQWSSSASYPDSTGLDYPSCVASDGTVACVGGYSGPTISSAIYSAPLSASGVGSWSAAASYPIAVWGESCVTSSGTGYCIGGESSSGVSNSVYASSARGTSQTSTRSLSLTTSTFTSPSTESSQSGILTYKGTFSYVVPLGPSGINDSTGKPVQWNSTQTSSGTFTFSINPQNYSGSGSGRGMITVATKGFCTGSETVSYTFAIEAFHLPGENITVAFENPSVANVTVPLTCQGSTVGFATANNPVPFLSVYPNEVTVDSIPATISQPQTNGLEYSIVITEES